jgi:hypothetical protein
MFGGSQVAYELSGECYRVLVRGEEWRPGPVQQAAGIADRMHRWLINEFTASGHL